MRELGDGRTRETARVSIDGWIDAVYDDLRALAAGYLVREGRVGGLEPTALVHESYLRLLRQDRTDWRERAHVVAVGARIMQRVIADERRAALRAKRGGRAGRVQLVDELALAPSVSHDDVLDAALRRLAAFDPRLAEVVHLRFFAGMTVQAVAATLGVSKRTVESDWTMARAWLRRALTEGP